MLSRAGSLASSATGRAVSTATGAVSTVRLLAETRLLAPVRPDRIPGMAQAVIRFGTTPAAALAAGAARHPNRVAVCDDEGSFTYAELDRLSNAAAHGLLERGVEPGSRVALLARNSAGFVVAMAGLGKVGATVVYLNTGFAGPALARALDDENVVGVVYEPEFRELLAEGLRTRPGWLLDAAPFDESGSTQRPPRPSSHGSHVILTSGTTGRAKGAERSIPKGLGGLEPLTALLGAIPLRAGEPTVVAAPMFHTWGFAHLGVGLLLGSTLVVHRRFEPAVALADVDRHRATALIAVPVMLQRMLELPESATADLDLTSLRTVPTSGSALPVEVTRRFADRFADAIYNMYGSTEVAYATVASPADMRDAPGTVGRPVRGTVVRILDEDGNELPQGEVGRIFVGNSMTFAGYTSGGDKQRVEGLVATGDVGRFDEDGRLFVEGRDDDMIVSGGENIFPGQVEELLISLPDVADAAVVGVPDEKFGARLVAHVVARDGTSLDVDGLRGKVRESLGRIYVPRDVVLHDELPRNATGKVLKRELRSDEEKDSA
jgi:acyl-CoA synthetase (AMP-forming)/AMP-acid ligase II